MNRIPPFAYDASFAVAIIALVLMLSWTVPPVQATAAKQPEVGCEVVGTVGAIIISHCVDQNDNEFEANSAGMLLSIGN